MRKTFVWIAALVIVAGVAVWAQTQTQTGQTSTQQSQTTGSQDKDIYSMLKDDHNKIMSYFDKIVPDNWNKKSSSETAPTYGQTGQMGQTEKTEKTEKTEQTGQTGQMGQMGQTPSQVPSQYSTDFEQLKNLLQTHMRGEEQYFYPVLQQDPQSMRDATIAFEEHWVAKRVLNQLAGMSGTGMERSEMGETKRSELGEKREETGEKREEMGETKREETREQQTGQTQTQTGRETEKYGTPTESQSSMNTQDRWLARCFVLRQLIENHVKNEEGPLFSAARKVIQKDQATQIAQQYSQLRSQIVTG